jgi:hypothetical protein
VIPPEEFLMIDADVPLVESIIMNVEDQAAPEDGGPGRSQVDPLNVISGLDPPVE